MLVHEFGHYYFAKRAGILVREFSIGMGPKIWWSRRNGTTYTIRLLPLGGYVRLAGADEDDDETLRPGTPVTLQMNDQNEVVTINESEVKKFKVNHDANVIEKDGTEVRIAPRDVQINSASLPHRMMTNFAGPMNNFILALVVFVILGFTLPGIPTNSNKIGRVQTSSVAAKAGIKSGDRIIKVNGHRTTNWQEMTSVISSHPGKKITVQFKHGEKTTTTQMIPKKVRRGKQTVGQIGIMEMQRTDFKSRVLYGWHQFILSGTLIFSVLGHMFTHGFSLNDLGGPVAIYAGTSQATSLGVNGVLAFLAMLSINLGIVNLLPIPALDGGKLVLNIIEGIIRRPIPEKAEGIVTLVGFAFLLLLMILVTWNDIQRYFIR